jgi:predicted XRE-type DNA-binding protein
MNRTEFEESSGNVFADLGLDDAQELQARGLVGIQVFRLLKEKNMKQREIAALLTIKQAEVSHLLNGHFSRFSLDKLFDFLHKLNHKVVIEVSPHQQGEPFQKVFLSSMPAETPTNSGTPYCPDF